MATYIVLAPRWTKVMLGTLLANVSRVHLYKNDYVPDRPDDTTALFTESDPTGYASADCSTGWTAPALDGNSTAYADHIDFTFTVTADSAEQYVYGWYMTDGAGNLLCSQRGEGVDFPFPFYRLGDRVVVRIRLTQESYGPPPPPAP